MSDISQRFGLLYHIHVDETKHYVTNERLVCIIDKLSDIERRALEIKVYINRIMLMLSNDNTELIVFKSFRLMVQVDGLG